MHRQNQAQRGLPPQADETNELIAARDEISKCIEGCRTRLRRQRLAHQHIVDHVATVERQAFDETAHANFAVNEIEIAKLEDEAELEEATR